MAISLQCTAEDQYQVIYRLRSFRLVALLDMIRIQGAAFFNLSQALAGLDMVLYLDDETSARQLLADTNVEGIISDLENAARHLERSDLQMSLISLRKLIDAFRLQKPKEIRELAIEVHGRIRDELASVYLLQIPASKKRLYEGSNLFGENTSNKLPAAISDIEEAGKCLALSRSTACVFHLMRVMELGLQEFAKKLGITIDSTQQWQVIIDQANKAISNLPKQTMQDKAARSIYAESATHLYAVKLAWRNEVMHPRAVYTEEEAQNIFNNVRTFIQQLVSKVLI